MDLVKNQKYLNNLLNQPTDVLDHSGRTLLKNKNNFDSDNREHAQNVPARLWLSYEQAFFL